GVQEKGATGCGQFSRDCRLIKFDRDANAASNQFELMGTKVIVVLSILLLAITYIVARVWLIVLALMALRDLPNARRYSTALSRMMKMLNRYTILMGL
ncbi:hypothetical protein WG66_008887, partial [Moniliophthora roreri]